MKKRLVIDGNSVYEIDEECLQKRQSRGGNGNGRGGKNLSYANDRGSRCGGQNEKSQ